MLDNDSERIVDPDVAVRECGRHLRLFVEWCCDQSHGLDRGSSGEVDTRMYENTQLRAEMRQTAAAVGDMPDVALRQRFFRTLTDEILVAEDIIPSRDKGRLINLKHEVLSGLLESSLSQSQVVRLYIER